MVLSKTKCSLSFFIEPLLLPSLVRLCLTTSFQRGIQGKTDFVSRLTFLYAGKVGSGSSTESSSPSRHRLKKRASERSSGKWMQRPSAGTMLGGSSRHTPAATIMTEDANTEENTAGNSCGAYIETPCKFAACRALVLYHFNRSN